MDLGQDIWRTIPPEEKFDLIARSQARGVSASTVVILIGCTFAIALQQKWFMWGSFVMAPFVFQLAASRAWRGVKGKLMLQYLAVRSVARRFGYASHAPDLSIQLLLRANISESFDSENDSLDAAFEAIEKATNQTEMWLGLLNTAVVGFAEGKLGAEAKFVARIDERLKLEGRNTDGSDDEYSNERELYLTVIGNDLMPRKFRIDSPHPAALVAFEKKFFALQERIAQQKRDATQELPAPAEEDFRDHDYR